MAVKAKIPEWKTIADADKRAVATRTSQLRAARLARDAALPPTPPATARVRVKKKPA